ncbi:hypothetical protein GQ44DRAFT_773049 [Phaeosphaeriaceae sp. PMI808]|nr:hypothetical protein GQ44DRAFT_773049 [Phaeosphaeriaceae sp. PMI808]
MSVSDTSSTIAPSSDIDGISRSQEEHLEVLYDDRVKGVSKKVRRVRKHPPMITAAYGENDSNDFESIQQEEHQEGKADETIVSYGKSPYADAEIVFLQVGSDATPFGVHHTILAQSAVLNANVGRWGMVKGHVPMPELDEMAAHTLVHYLYTGSYQSMCASSPIEKVLVPSYKLDTCVYCAAVRYQLSGLAELAKDRIISFGRDLSISDVLITAKDAFPLLPENETWYPIYLEDAIKSAMIKDPEPFRRPEFITQVEGNSKLLQVVWRTVMSNYPTPSVASKPENSKNRTSTNEVILAEHTLINKQGPEKPKELQPVVTGDLKQSLESKPAVDSQATLPVPPHAKAVTASLAPLDDVFKLPDIDPTVAETPRVPEPFTDELGFEKSKMYQNQKIGKPEPKSELQIVADQQIERPAHKRNDSLMQAEQLVTSSPQGMVASPSQEAGGVIEKLGDIAPLEVVGSTETVTTPKKNKKKKKKNTSKVSKGTEP